MIPVLRRQGSLHRKLVEVAAEVGKIEKLGVNEEHHYNYVRAQDVMERVRALFTEKKILLVPELLKATREFGTTRNGAPRVHATVRMGFTLYDLESDDCLSVDWEGDGLDTPGDKAIYKAVVGCTKYFLLTLFMVAQDEPEQVRRGQARTTQGRPATPQAPPATAPTPAPKQKIEGANQRRYFALLEKAVKAGLYPVSIKERSAAGHLLRQEVREKLLGRPLAQGEAMTEALWGSVADALDDLLRYMSQGYVPNAPDEPPPPTDSDLPF